LTFNATPLLIARLKQTPLVERRPLRATGNFVRRIFVTKEIDAFLNTNVPYFPRPNAEITFGTFCSGHSMTVTRKMGVRADLELMEDTDEVWIMCFRKPKVGQGRLLGRFVSRNIFVGTRIATREEIANDTYPVVAAGVIDTWDEITGGIRPVRSNNFDDYLGSQFRDLDNEDD
jgi:hypothetical protein